MKLSEVFLIWILLKFQLVANEKFYSFGNRSVKVFTPASWYTANETCRRESMTLLTITSDQDLVELRDLSDRLSVTQFWIEVAKEESASGAFNWAAEKKVIATDGNKTTLASGNCSMVEIFATTISWFEDPCIYAWAFICEEVIHVDEKSIEDKLKRDHESCKRAYRNLSRIIGRQRKRIEYMQWEIHDNEEIVKKLRMQYEQLPTEGSEQLNCRKEGGSEIHQTKDELDGLRGQKRELVICLGVVTTLFISILGILFVAHKKLIRKIGATPVGTALKKIPCT